MTCKDEWTTVDTSQH